MKPFWVPFGAGKRKKESLYADIYARSLASGIDITILFMLLFDQLEKIKQRFFPDVTSTLFERIAHSQDPALRAHLLGQWAGNFTVQFMAIGVLFVLFQIFYGTTPGKWLVGIKVVRRGTHAKLEWWRYILRYIAYAPSCITILGLLCISFNKERRALHDYIAGTVVLNLRLRGWYWNHAKRLYAKLRRKSSVPLEQPVGEPAAEQRHQDGSDPV